MITFLSDLTKTSQELPYGALAGGFSGDDSNMGAIKDKLAEYNGFEASDDLNADTLLKIPTSLRIQ